MPHKYATIYPFLQVQLGKTCLSTWIYNILWSYLNLHTSYCVILSGIAVAGGQVIAILSTIDKLRADRHIPAPRTLPLFREDAVKMVEENSSDALFAEVDQKLELLRKHLKDREAAAECFRRLDVSTIYHDFAIEGVVLAFPELNSAIDDAIVSDITLIPAYEDVKNHRDAIRHVREMAAKKKFAVDGEYLKGLHTLLCTEICERPGKAPPQPPAGQYRKDMPLHRLYFHEIAPPEKIAYQVRKFVQWLGEADTVKMHPVRRAGIAHHRLISIYPWPRHSGKISRLVMNALLVHDGYLPAVIHAIDRQRYYEVLKQGVGGLVELVAESLSTTYDSALQFFGVDVKALNRAIS